MTVKKTTTRLMSLAAAAAIATPALAANQSQSSDQSRTDNARAQQEQQLSEAARQCLQDLRKVNDDLAGAGYGRVGPEGYAGYGSGYETLGGTEGAPTMRTAGMGSPRGDMRTLMRAGHIMARTGHVEGCQAVVATAQDMGERYDQAMEDGEIDREAMTEWRNQYLASAVPVTELDRRMSVEEVLESDVRNYNDEDLGDVEDVITGSQGEIRYILVETGGFLDIGDEEVPVRWQDLAVTQQPYRDTLVLDVPEEAFEDAPGIADSASLLEDGELQDEVESFWADAGLGEHGERKTRDQQ